MSIVNFMNSIAKIHPMGNMRLSVTNSLYLDITIMTIIMEEIIIINLAFQGVIMDGVGEGLDGAGVGKVIMAVEEEEEEFLILLPSWEVWRSSRTVDFH